MGAMKDRLVEAAELLGMDPADLLSKLDPNGDNVCVLCGADPLTAARAFASGEESGRRSASERFAGFDDTESDREPSPEQERAWDVREDEARGSAL